VLVEPFPNNSYSFSVEFVPLSLDPVGVVEVSGSSLSLVLAIEEVGSDGSSLEDFLLNFGKPQSLLNDVK